MLTLNDVAVNKVALVLACSSLIEHIDLLPIKSNLVMIERLNLRWELSF